jgi:hypothetical protein
MMCKAIGVVRCTSKTELKERFIISFRTVKEGRAGSVVLQMEPDVAEYFNYGEEYVLSFEKVKHSDSA